MSHLRLVHSKSNIEIPVRHEPPTLHKGKTCRKNCTFFNDDLGKCTMFAGVDYDDPKVANRCLEFTDVTRLQSYYQDYSDNLDETMKKEEWESGDTQIFLEKDLLELVDSEENHQQFSSYPFEPDIRLDNRFIDLQWHISEDLSYGCWIQNKCKITDNLRPKGNLVVVDKEKYAFKSAIPVFDHKASRSLQSRMVWVVDEKGYGQYGVAIGDTIHILERS